MKNMIKSTKNYSSNVISREELLRSDGLNPDDYIPSEEATL